MSPGHSLTYNKTKGSRYYSLQTNVKSQRFKIQKLIKTQNNVHFDSPNIWLKEFIMDTETKCVIRKTTQ